MRIGNRLKVLTFSAFFQSDIYRVRSGYSQTSISRSQYESPCRQEEARARRGADTMPGTSNFLFKFFTAFQGIDCIYESRPGSKYCSDDCGRSIARARLLRFLPQKVKEYWKTIPQSEVYYPFYYLNTLDLDSVSCLGKRERNPDRGYQRRVTETTGDGSDDGEIR